MGNQDVAAVLRETVAVMEQHGWCQNEYQNDNGSFCTIGALDTACRINGYVRSSEVYFTARKVLSTSFNAGIADWNDTPGRTDAEVKKTLLGIADEIEVL